MLERMLLERIQKPRPGIDHSTGEKVQIVTVCSGEITRLKQEIEALDKEIEALGKEIEALDKEWRSKSDTAKTGTLRDGHVTDGV